MKRLLVLAITLIGIQFAVSAQVQEKRDTIRPHHKGDVRSKMKDELNLSKEQSEKMKAIHADSKARMQALRDDKSLSDADRKAKAAGIMKERKEKTDAILNPEQREKMKQWGEKMKEHRKGEGKKHWKEGKGRKKDAKEKEAEKTEQ
jgi:protein CpxP